MTPKGHAINRVLHAWGLPDLGAPGVVEILAQMVQDHQHLTELLRACDPTLRREMYEAMRPYLRFPAKPLEDYIIAAKEQAEARELPLMDEYGNMHPFMAPVAQNGSTLRPVTLEEVIVTCSRCGRSTAFGGERHADAIHMARKHGWAWDETVAGKHICPDCLDQI